MSRVGLIYDPIYLSHDTGGHVENKGRLLEVMSVLEQSGTKDKLVPIPPRPASIEELTLVHPPRYVAYIKEASEKGGGWLDMDTVTSPGSYEAAVYAAGGVIKGVEAMMSGEVASAFALVRPPGHHATPTQAMGFCLFNNVAIAARSALLQHHLERILIVDFDVHHGNGTQDIFYHEPQVLYFSTHQYPFYPGSGGVREWGEGAGEGFTVNVPLPAGCGDAEYLRVFEEILTPVARHFKPELILVSAGYDAHWADPIASMQVSCDGYAGMVRTLKGLAEELCQGKLMFTMEGGYNLEALAYSVRATLEVLLGEPVSPDPLGKEARWQNPPNTESLLASIKQLHGLAPAR